MVFTKKIYIYKTLLIFQLKRMLVTQLQYVTLLDYAPRLLYLHHKDYPCKPVSLAMFSIELDCCAQDQTSTITTIEVKFKEKFECWIDSLA